MGRSPGEEKGYPLLYSGLENSIDCIIHGIAESQTRLSDFHFLSYYRARESQGPGFLGKSIYCTRECEWQLTPVLLPGKPHGRRSLVGCSPWGLEESDTTELDTTERLDFHFSLSCIGEGNGSLLQCSCLENPRDGGAWWAAVSGVPQSRTRLK